MKKALFLLALILAGRLSATPPTEYYYKYTIPVLPNGSPWPTPGGASIAVTNTFTPTATGTPVTNTLTPTPTNTPTITNTATPNQSGVNVTPTTTAGAWQNTGVQVSGSGTDLACITIKNNGVQGPFSYVIKPNGTQTPTQDAGTYVNVSTSSQEVLPAGWWVWWKPNQQTDEMCVDQRFPLVPGGGCK